MCYVPVLQLRDTKRQRYYLSSAEHGAEHGAAETNHLDIRYRDEWEGMSSTCGSTKHGFGTKYYVPLCFTEIV